jgi:hypothetical protein
MNVCPVNAVVQRETEFFPGIERIRKIFLIPHVLGELICINIQFFSHEDTPQHIAELHLFLTHGIFGFADYLDILVDLGNAAFTAVLYLSPQSLSSSSHTSLKGALSL